MNWDKYILERQEVLLFIIDIQEKLLPVIASREELIKNNKILIKASQILDFPVLVSEQYPKGLGETIRELKEELNPWPIYEKSSFSAYSQEIARALERFKRPKILVTGIEAHVCVLQTVRDLLINGYQVFVVDDAISSRTAENYKSAKALMMEMGAVLINTESVVFDLLKVSGTPEFKKLSALIK